LDEAAIADLNAHIAASVGRSTTPEAAERDRGARRTSVDDAPHLPREILTGRGGSDLLLAALMNMLLISRQIPGP
jgi:hypothetical protein